MSYKGIKDFINEFREPFDPKSKSLKLAKERLKEKGEKATEENIKIEVALIKEEWDNKQKRGTKLHKEIQNQKAKIKNTIVEGREVIIKGSTPDPSTNLLSNGFTYIEKKIVSAKYGLVGYADEVKVVKNFIHIEDIKTTEKIYRSSAIKLKNGFTVPPTYFFPPIDKIQDSNFYEAALQVSLYMYILWIHNKRLKPGKLYIRHIKTNSQDKIIKEELIELPYLRDEVKAMLKHRKLNAL